MNERIARIREKLREIVCTDGDDRGVIYLSHESLIELWDMVEAEPGWGDWRSVTESGWYWLGIHDLDSAPVPVSVLTDSHGTYFASTGQLGWTRAQNVDEMGGLWMPVTEPEVPRELGEACDL